MNKVSSLAPGKFPNLPNVAGVAFASGSGDIKYNNKNDVLLAEFVTGTVAAGVFTKSKTPAAAVNWCREILGKKEVRGLVVNSGNANAFTGQSGIEAVDTISRKAAEIIGCRDDQIFLAQTGVIGERLPVEKITNILSELHTKLGSGWEEAAVTICTTDTYPKGSARTAIINGKKIKIVGIAKGSGMIAPDMATMLAFIFTDVAISKAELQKLLVKTTDKTFNCWK